MRRPLGRVLDVALLVVILAIAAAAWWPIYRHPRFLVVAAAAILLGLAIALLAARRRWSPPLVLLATAVVFAVVGVPLAVPAKAIGGVLPSLDGLLDLLAAVALGWKQLVTITLPVGDYQSLLVPPLALLLAATVLAISLAVRVDGPRGDTAVLAPIVVYIGGIVFGGDRPGLAVVLALAMLASVLLWLVIRRRRRRRDAIRRLAGATDAGGGVAEAPFGVRALLAAVLALVLAGAGAGAAVSVAPPTAEREVLRTAIAQPFDPRQYPSPLSGFRRYLHDDRVDAVQFTIEGLPEGARVRIATLDDFDGVVYAVGSGEASSGTFVRIPQAVERSDDDGEPVEVEITIEGYRGVWLPTVGLFESVGFSGDRAAARRDAFFYNDVTGTAAVLGGVEDGDAYVLRAVLPPQPPADGIAALSPGSATVPRLEGFPEELALALEDVVRGVESPGGRLDAAIAFLRENGYVSSGLDEDDPPSRSGHSADRIAELVTAPLMIGDAEQYAVAAALLARQVGFPARVVLGFAPQSTAVTGEDITAWIEVDTAEFGWVAIDPVPEERPIPEDEPEDPNQVARPPSIVPPPPDRPDPQIDQSVPDADREEPATMDPFLAALLATARILGVGLLVLLVLAAPFLVIIAAKARRRRLRASAPSPLQRIRGGWDEFADAVLDHGYEPPPSATRSEVAEVVGTLPARVLAAVADRAVFSPVDPDPAEADRVWDAVRDLRESLDLGLRRRERLRALISLRSLGAYSVRNLWTLGGRGR